MTARQKRSGLGYGIAMAAALTLAPVLTAPVATRQAAVAPAAVDSLIDGFAKSTVASVSDAVDQIIGRRGFLSHDMRPYVAGAFVGRAATALVKPAPPDQATPALAVKHSVEMIDAAAEGEVGVIVMEGTLDIAASQKGGRFVAMCDSFNLPLVTLVDTSGFYPGKDLEWRGMIRYGAQMAFAYARATVPRVNVTLRKSYGGAYIVMDSKYMGNDIAFAWPSAEIAVMGAKGAVEILHRRLSPEERTEKELEYEDRLLNPYIAASRGSVDAVIDPADTRAAVAGALELLSSKRERLPRRRHDNTPL